MFQPLVLHFVFGEVYIMHETLGAGRRWVANIALHLSIVAVQTQGVQSTPSCKQFCVALSAHDEAVMDCESATAVSDITYTQVHSDYEYQFSVLITVQTVSAGISGGKELLVIAFFRVSEC